MPPIQAATNGNSQSPDGKLSDSDISMLSDIGELTPDLKDAGKKSRLERLIAQGFVEPTNGRQAPAKYQLTEKAQQLLISRGAGLNEA